MDHERRIKKTPPASVHSSTDVQYAGTLYPVQYGPGSRHWDEVLKLKQEMRGLYIAQQVGGNEVSVKTPHQGISLICAMRYRGFLKSIISIPECKRRRS